MTGETTPMVALADADPVMAGLIARIGPMTLERRRRGRPRGDAYGVLLRAIVGQQLSAKAAATIFDRVLALYDGKVPTAAQLLETDEETLRGVGLSGRKVEYVKDLAGHVVDGELEVERLGDLTDDKVIEEITAVRGLGVWTAHMFLIFHLEREDVLPVGDLGVRNAIKAEYGLDEPPTPAEMEELAEPWRPHRTLASLYLWESLSNTPA
jgi:DNA-3-methyladenine glycosylase II